MRLYILTTAILLASGCANQQTVEPEPPSLPEYYIQDDNSSVDHSQGLQSASRAHGMWWEKFNDEKLNQLVQLALVDNYSLKVSYARLMQSQAQWEGAGAARYPDLNLNLERSKQWQEPGAIDRNQTSLGLSASYEIDFWGRVAALDEQALQGFYASESALNIQTNTVVSQVVLSWYGWVKETHHLQLLEHQQQRIENGLKVIQGRFLRGKVAASDIWQQEQLLESLRTDIINTQTRQDVYRQQLSLWLGKHRLDEHLITLPSQQYKIPALESAITEVDSRALQERPDVLMSYAQLQEASAGLTVAEANRYPRFTLSASYNSVSESPENILTNWSSNFIAGLTAPIFDGGRLASEVKRNEERVSEQLANYQQVLLSAMQEIEEALLNEKQQFALQASTQYQLQLANQTQLYQSKRYQRGAGDFLSLLKSQQDVLTLERQALTAGFLQLQYRINLLTTLSHGRFVAINDKETEHE